MTDPAILLTMIGYMLMMLVILSTAIGTVTGVVATVFLMQRKGQFLASGADLAARQKAAELERSLAAAYATVEDLRKQMAAQGQVLQQNREELEKKQQEMDSELSRRSAAEQQVGPLQERIRELTAQVEDERRQKEELAGWNVTLTAQAGQQSEAIAEQLRQAEAKSSGEREAVSGELGAVKREKEELIARLAALEPLAAAYQALKSELESAKHEKELLVGQLKEADAKAASERQTVSTDAESAKKERDALAAQLRDLEAKAASERLAVWAELDGVRRENEELTSQAREMKARFATELEAEKKIKEEWEQRHAALTAEFSQQAGTLAQKVQALETQLSEQRLRFASELDAARQQREELESEVERERSSAAEGMELLSLAHKKFSGVFEMRFAESRAANGNGHHPANGTTGGEHLPVPALSLAADDEAVFAFAPEEPHAMSEVAGD